ncbi:MAG: beta-lactamase family protein [Actinobacteria bacterium]|nr:beta-lactamase family protein [Actinomycetota bacterium]MBU1945012.1 beta-lactamase family protein [Actinomycetota bacterium]MBU2686652.1 beta-lactamase family protein [Actinomycetota bacterium]
MTTRRKRARNLLLAALPLAALLAVLTVAGSSCGASTFGKGIEQQLTATVEKIMKDNGVPGAIVGVWEKGKAYTRAFGKADVEKGTAMKVTDLFRAASITKTFTAIVMLQLAQEDKLGLDDKLGEFEFAKGLPNADKVTLRMLLNHTSGYSDLENNDPAFQAEMAANPEKQWTHEEILKWGATLPVLSPPGEQYHYSNWGYYLLGLVMEKVTGNTAAEEIQGRCADKVGLETTRLEDGPEFLTSKPHSAGYAAPGIPMVPATPPEGQQFFDATEWNTSAGWTAASIVTDLDDLRKWIEADANGSLLNKQMQTEQLRTIQTDGGLLYGLGLAGTPTNKGDLLLHNGAVPGYSALAASTPDNSVTIVVFMNAMPTTTVNTNVATDTALALFQVLGGKSATQ